MDGSVQYHPEYGNRIQHLQDGGVIQRRAKDHKLRCGDSLPVIQNGILSDRSVLRSDGEFGALGSAGNAVVSVPVCE